jgi:arylsulfatase A-like enzyme
LAELKKRFGLDNTIIIITSDHGEEFGEHGWQGHSVALHEESLHIPLIIVGKDVPRGEVRQSLTSMTMLAPQILELAGLPDPLKRDWRQIAAEPLAYAHTAIFGPARYSFRVPGWSFVTANEYKFGEKQVSRPPGLYADRAEQTNLLSEQPEKAAEMQAAMERYVGEQLKTYGAMKAGALELDPARLQKMKELGYVN